MRLSEEQKSQLETEIKFSASRSSGPGGQNVNKVNTRVELRFSIPETSVFRDDQKTTLLQKLKNRINSEDELLLTSESERSQWRNKDKTKTLFFQLIETALTPPKKRIKTKPTKASRIKRMENKKLLAEKKARRKPPGF